jgi:hypothetical protein
MVYYGVTDLLVNKSRPGENGLLSFVFLWLFSKSGLSVVPAAR